MYIVKYDFVDLQDNNWAYCAGETYPREGYTPDESRIKELSTTANAQGRELIVLTKSSQVKDIDSQSGERKAPETVPVTPQPESKTTKPLSK